MSGKRADVALVERGLFASRAKAQAAIAAGKCFADGVPIAKPSELVSETAAVTAEAAHPWVGRAALKLEHAFQTWPLNAEGRVVLDIGASTGGFTEVCLSHGARIVYAVDVGQGQLAARIADDARVWNLEQRDARSLSRSDVPQPIDLVVCDASFISLEKVLPVPLSLAADDATLVCLVKPQFEAGPERVGKGGVVRDAGVRADCLARVGAWLTAIGWSVQAACESPITGSDGNVEFLLLATKGTAARSLGRP
jgi:23S rRNA (cytidine1920-2'-O)/16S rRNA (cytidine1409-2'-O)-methyltransferase